MWIALFGPGALAANTIACAAAAGAAAASSAITAGLLAVGAEHGWQWYKGSGTVNRMAKRSTGGVMFHSKLGTLHAIDDELSDSFERMYGAKVKAKGYSLSKVLRMSTVWALGSDVQSLNSSVIAQTSNVSSISFYGDTYMHTAVGHVLDLHNMVNSFIEWNPDVSSNHTLGKRDNLSIDWASYTTYGMNVDEANFDYMEIEELANNMKSDYDEQTWIDYYGWTEKQCLSLGPEGDAAGVDSIIVGELYWNQYGGLDNQCQSG
ncbi:hypothetical protein V1523DRAFT_429855 [Lipomyces doorenjongii]